MKSVTFLTAAVLVSLAAVAQAGQKFSFQDPISAGSYTNAMLESNSLYSGNTYPAASLKNIYTGNVLLTVDNFTSTGGYSGSSSVLAKYYLSKSGGNVNDNLVGTLTAGLYATGAGQVTFVNPANESQTYLQVAFSKSGLAYGSFAAAETLTFSGSLFNTGETGNENASFGFLDDFTSGGAIDHHTTSFTASIGTIGTIQATPEPAPLAAFGVGALALLRRRRA